MPRLLRTLLLLPLLLAPAFPAAAMGVFTLTLDPTQSSLTPMLGTPQSLSGTLTLSVGDAPPGGGNRAFDLVGLALTASGGGTIGIDPSVIGPLLGVLHPAGDWLFPLLSLQVTQPSSFDLPLAIPDVTGVVTFGPDGSSLASLSTAFSIDTGLTAGNLAVNVVAVPEPGTLLLSAGALAMLAALSRQRREVVR
ncbi:MAG TPA: PEP-CTERM sorting domain-containing protein [Myxococcota bacterium]|nr:PEP-CTERM sorting domain-containing protein [Myxococcota bacterium]